MLDQRAQAAQFGLEAEPSPERLARLVRQKGELDESTYSALKGMLANMQRVEAAVASGRTAKVPRTMVADAARMAAEILAACEADAPHLVRAVRRGLPEAEPDPEKRETGESAA